MPKLSLENIHNCYYLPCSALLLAILLAFYTSYWAGDISHNLTNLERTTGHRILSYIATNLISKPIKNFKLLPIGDSVCPTGFQEFQIGSFYGLKSGCRCNPMSGEYVTYSSNCTNEDGNFCKGYKEIKATGVLPAYLWNGQNWCVQYFETYTNLLQH